MKKVTNWLGLSFFAIVLSTLLAACGGGETHFGRVAVIDLDAIAVATGKSTAIKEALTELIKERDSQFTTLKGELVAKVDAEKSKIGKKPSAKQKQSLQETVNMARQELNKNLTSAKQDAQKFKLKLINDFKQEILPVAIKVATKKNYSVVLLKNATLFYVETDADITKDVIAELNKDVK